MPISLSDESAIDLGHRGEIFGQHAQVVANLQFASTKQVRACLKMPDLMVTKRGDGVGCGSLPNEFTPERCPRCARNPERVGGGASTSQRFVAQSIGTAIPRSQRLGRSA